MVSTCGLIGESEGGTHGRDDAGWDVEMGERKGEEERHWNVL